MWIFQKFNTYIAKHFLNENIIICCIFNCQLGNNTDKSNIEPKGRIDYVLIIESFLNTLSDIKARKIPRTHSNGCRKSDHRFLKFWFDIDKTKKGPGYLKLDISYFEKMKDTK